MKKLFIVLGCITLLASASLYGQRNPQKKEQSDKKVRIEKRAQEQVDKISEEMDLTKKQEKDLFKHYSKIEAEKEREREIAQREREKVEAERNKKMEESDRELERILGQEKFEEHKQRRAESGEDKKDKVLDNFFDFMGDSFELDGRQRDALREYYLNQEKNLKKIIKRLESKQDDIEKIMKEQEDKMDEIFKKGNDENTNFNATSQSI